MVQTLKRLAILVAALAGCATVFAQEPFPSRPIRVVVPQPTGTGGDIAARLMAERFKAELGQPGVVENRTGANGIIAMGFLAKQPADGHTLLLAGVSQMSFNHHLYRDATFDTQKDFTVVSPTVEVPFVLVASRKSGVRTWPELAEHAKRRPGGVNYASGGVANSTHLAMAMLASRTSLPATHVPYGGSSGAVLGVVSGESDVMVSPLPIALAQIQSGGLVPVAMLSAARVAQLPAVPTLREAGLDVPHMPGWYALIGPAGIDPRTVQKIHEAVNRILADATVRAKLDPLGMFVVGGTPAQARERVATDSRTWGELIRSEKIPVQ